MGELLKYRGGSEVLRWRLLDFFLRQKSALRDFRARAEGISEPAFALRTSPCQTHGFEFYDSMRDDRTV